VEAPLQVVVPRLAEAGLRLGQGGPGFEPVFRSQQLLGPAQQLDDLVPPLPLGGEVALPQPGAAPCAQGQDEQAGHGQSSRQPPRPLLRLGLGLGRLLLPSLGFDPAPWDGYGGGILNFGRLTINSCVLSGSSAHIWGGGISNGGTLSGNSAGDGGGGIFNAGTLTVSGSTLSGNSSVDGGGIFNNKHAHATIKSSVVLNNSARPGPTSTSSPA
jgi:hypothetical protein